MAITLITGDLHFSDNVRDDYRHQWIKWLTDTIKSKKVDLLIVLGDICEVKDNHGAWLVNQVVDHIHRISALCSVSIVMGNHDYLQPDNPFFEFLGRMEQVEWIGNPLHRNLYRGLRNFLFLPHTRNYQKDWEPFLRLKPDWAFCHQTFQGAKVGPRQMEGIPLSIFPNKTKIISGDIHYPQQIGQLTYVGAPYTINFGDSYEPRVLLIDNDKITSIPCTGPQKRLIQASSIKQLKAHKGLHENDLVKVRFQLSSDGYDKWSAIKDEIRRWGEDNGYILEIIQPVMESKPRTHRKVDIKSDEQLIKSFAKRVGLSDKVLDTGLKIISEV